MAVVVAPPFPIFTDTAGRPLDAGFIYFGVANQDPVTNPVAVFWDADLTIPAPNPVRTSGGFIWRSGSPANVFTADNYSMRVCDKGNTQLYVIPSTSATGLGDITLGAGDVLTANAGSTIDIRDGAAFKIGSNSGTAVEVEIADNARFVGDIIAGSDGKIGTVASPWPEGNFTVARVETLPVAVCVANNPTPASVRDLVGLDQNKSSLAGCHVDASGTVLGTAYNIASVVAAGAGVYTYTLDFGVDDNAEVQVTVDHTTTNPSANYFSSITAQLVVDGIGKTIVVIHQRYSLGAGTIVGINNAHWLSVKGRPRTLLPSV